MGCGSSIITFFIIFAFMMALDAELQRRKIKKILKGFFKSKATSVDATNYLQQIKDWTEAQ